VSTPTFFRRDTPLVPIRGVHLDLKGLPPTPSRLLELLNLFAAARFNCVLVEWEDSFPWDVDERFRSETAYTPDDVQAFHRRASHLDLRVIPLVQSLGHMETPLGLDAYRALREVPHRCDTLNPLAPGARQLVEGMIDDVLRRSGPLTHFHLGGDEAFCLGTHPATQSFIERHGKAALYLHHLEPLLDKLLERGIRPILWHDMMHDWDDAALARLAMKADVMVWSYHGQPDARTIERLIAAGVTVWGASAYKGADSRGDAELPDADRRAANAAAWADVASHVPLRGIVATGWSRYQTTRVQCEPIDGALDSLVRTAAALHDGAPCDGPTAETFLASIGELDAFGGCRAALGRLSVARRSTWEYIRLHHEQTSLERRDPRRRETGVPEELLRLAGEQFASMEKVTVDVERAFARLVPSVAICAFLAERLEPVREWLERRPS
jgi:hexosaminidase